MRKAILLTTNPHQLHEVYSTDHIHRLQEIVDLHEDIILLDHLEEMKHVTCDTEFIFSTWGMPSITEEMIETYFPQLKVVFYAAGSVQAFARPFLKKGVIVTSAYSANAIPTAEFAACQITLANKGYFQSLVSSRNDYFEVKNRQHTYPGNYGIKVGLLGAGAVGSHVIRLLKQMGLSIDILVFDPFLSDERAHELGVTKVSLEEIFSTCQTISNHLANNNETKGMLTKKHFDLMLPNATFINTGRGQQVVEEDLIQALKEVPTRTAVLDVTDPEPPLESSELYTVDNVILTPHIAGSTGQEVWRMTDYMIEECKRYLNGETLWYSISLEDLKHMA